MLNLFKELMRAGKCREEREALKGCVDDVPLLGSSPSLLHDSPDFSRFSFSLFNAKFYDY
jgi:hypothetical protein